MGKLARLDFSEIDLEKVKSIFEPDKKDFLDKAMDAWDKYPSAQIALKVIAASGVIAMSILMPGLGVLIGSEIKRKERDRYRKMFKRWQAQKIVNIKYTPEGNIVEITEEGIKRALKFKLDEMSIKKPKIWDRKWRIIIFDVEEYKKSSRDLFRNYLKKLGFYMLNRSVFVYPDDCFDEIEYLRQITGVGMEVTYIVADSIETSANLKNYFDL